MFIITADQIDSTHLADIAGEAVNTLNDRYGSELALQADRTAGDEIQALTSSATTALAIVLDLTRTGQWSVGCGVGAVRTPLPTNTREATGPGFVAARSAVGQAKGAQSRFALVTETSSESADPGPLVDLLLLLRSRRTREGWELFDLVAAGMTQADAAAELRITPQAASKRARAAGIRTELAAMPVLADLLASSDVSRLEH
jgi:hypothetical protein